MEENTFDPLKFDSAKRTIGNERNVLREQVQQLERQNFPMALVAGGFAAIVCAILWMFISVSTKYQIDYFAIVVGIIVAITVKNFGKGIERKFGLAGAILALSGCLLGKVLSIIGFAAEEFNTGFVHALFNLDLEIISNEIIRSWGPLDYLFYAIAAYEGYRFSFTKIGTPFAN